MKLSKNMKRTLKSLRCQNNPNDLDITNAHQATMWALYDRGLVRLPQSLDLPDCCNLFDGPISLTHRGRVISI